MNPPAASTIGKCCADIIEAQGDIEVLQRDVDENAKAAERWRYEHERKQDESMARLFTRLDSIDEKLANRLPAWATMAFAIGGGVIGSLITIVVMLSTHIFSKL